MISEFEALERLFETLTPLPGEQLPLADARGFYASEDVFAPADLPRFDHSAMDGYALRAADAGATLPVVGEQPAGPDRGLSLTPGAAVRIFTGAPLPAGAEGVVMQEDVDRSGDVITLRTAVKEGDFIRRQGGDVCTGQLVLRAGEPLTAARIGLLATLGFAAIKVHRRPGIALIGSGDELRSPGTPLAPGEIYESNTQLLAALLADQGFPTFSRVTTADDPDRIAASFKKAATGDVVVFTGGVSVGDHDHVPRLLLQHGVAIDFWRVAVKPGKPFLFGTSGSLAVFGLPGNPVSTFVTAVLFLLPALRHLAGASAQFARPRSLPAHAGRDLENPGDRPHYLRGQLDDGIFSPASLQESHGIAALAASNALARLAPHTRLAAGDPIRVIPLE